MKFLEDCLKDRCNSCNICCRFPQRDSPLIPFFLNKEIKDTGYFPCIGAYYGCRINVIRVGDGYICPYFVPDKNCCSIYSTRPADCQVYPFMITYDKSFEKVILVLDNACPYSKELAQERGVWAGFIDSIELTEQNLGFVNDPQPRTIFVSELPRLTEFVFGTHPPRRTKKLSLEDKDIFESYPKDTAGSSFTPLEKAVDFNRQLSLTGFTVLYLWKDIVNILWEITDNNLTVFYGTGDNLRQIPRDDKEYIYIKKDLIELKGNRYKDKRNLCNYFQKNYSYKIERLFPSADTIHSCLNLYKDWAECKMKKNRGLYYQQLIEDSFFFHRRALLDYDKLGLEGIKVIIDNKLAGYTYGFGLDNETFCVLGEITVSGYKGISQFIFRELCRAIPQDYIYINTMDDSEITGLRKNKLSYRPIRYPR